MLALSIHACVLKKTDETNERIKSAGQRLIEYNLVAPSLQSCDWTWFALTRCKVRDVAVPHSRAATPLLSSVSEKDVVAESATKLKKNETKCFRNCLSRMPKQWQLQCDLDGIGLNPQCRVDEA